MNVRQNAKAVLNYENYDRMPLVHFGYWTELLEQWSKEGHITEEEYKGYRDGNDCDRAISSRLGFDFQWTASFSCRGSLFPGFEKKKLQTLPDGSEIWRNYAGLIEKSKPGVTSIPQTIGTTLTSREVFDKEYVPRLQPSEKRIDFQTLNSLIEKQNSITDRAVGYHVGSLYGIIRDMLGVEELSYLYADDPDEYKELIELVGNVCIDNMKHVLQAGLRPDFCHFWEDICFKNGPLVNPAVFREYVAPIYKKIAELAHSYGCDLISLDCDGSIESLLPIWIENGVNVMFPIEYGTWGGSIEKLRRLCGREVRGVGGMNKLVFTQDHAAIDAEIERLKPLVALGGYIPCPDHRIPLGATWENVQYYCEQFRKAF